ncbi:MAG: hypothetical protein LBD24_04955 [Spirochaetaceae bacterium]|nr:hypothetical protein [Spirochaetaceae bacterium]
MREQVNPRYIPIILPYTGLRRLRPAAGGSISVLIGGSKRAEIAERRCAGRCLKQPEAAEAAEAGRGR